MLGQFGQGFWGPMMQRLHAQRGQHGRGQEQGQSSPWGGVMQGMQGEGSMQSRMPFGQAAPQQMPQDGTMQRQAMLPGMLQQMRLRPEGQPAMAQPQVQQVAAQQANNAANAQAMAAQQSDLQRQRGY